MAESAGCACVAVARSKDIGREPVRRSVAGVDFVLYRTRDGEVVMFDDLCPHRNAPLSRGRVHGDLLECVYHGLCFDTHGQCVARPGQEAMAALRVRRHAVQEHYGLIWLVPDEPEHGAAPAAPAGR